MSCMADSGTGAPLHAGERRRRPGREAREPPARVLERRAGGRAAQPQPLRAARLDRAVGVAPLRPRARVEPTRTEAGVLEHDKVMAGGHARAAVGDDRAGAVDAGGGEALPKLGAVEQAAIGAEMLAGREAAGAGDVAGTRIDRVRAL